MPRTLSLLVLVALCSCSQKSDPYLSSRQVFELMRTGDAWCQDDDASQACNLVSRLVEITERTVTRSEYAHAGSTKMVLDVTYRFDPAGLCTETSETMARSVRLFASTDRLATVGKNDLAILGADRERTLSAFVDALRPKFGQTTCVRYQVQSRSPDGKIRSVSAHTFIDGTLQPSSKPPMYTFFTQESDGIKLREYTSNTPR
jgi:hypothetical protein